MNDKLKTEYPIGIFDSGMGGLSHAKAIANGLPHQSLIYIGDIQHFPYGLKTTEELKSYCLPIVDYLLKQHCKIIVVACNTATAAAIDPIRDFVGDRAVVIDVVSLIVDYAAKHFAHQKLGLIGTEYTIGSKVYDKAFAAQAPSIELCSIATPSLIYHIETEINKLNPERTEVYDDLIRKYLSVPVLQDIQALILGCTHYPFVKDRISAYYQHKMPLIDSAVLVAEAISRHCEAALAAVAIQELAIDAPAGRLDCFGRKLPRNDERSHFFCTQVSEPFSQAVKYFFDQEAELLTL